MQRFGVSLALAILWVSSAGSAQVRGSAAVVPEGLSAADWSSLRAAYEASRHAAFAVGGGWEARSSGQAWSTRFDGRGFTVRPDAGGWTWGLELRRYGFVGRERDVVRPEHVRAEGERVAYEWDANLEEWYVNDGRGLEHGYTVRRPPGSAGHGENARRGRLAFALAVRGSLEPAVDEDGRGVRFLDEDGAAVLVYAGLSVFDADGRVLPARLERGSDGLLLTVDERAARYPLTIDPTAQQAYLKASNPGVKDSFGWSSSVSGDTVVVGAPYEDSNATGVNGHGASSDAADSGAAYVFVRDGATWRLEAYLKASNTGAGDVFGISVSVSGDTVVVGARGERSNATGVNGNQADNSVFLAGAAYVFVRDDTGWSQQAYLKAPSTDPSDFFGASVSVSGDTVVVGAFGEDGGSTGVNGNPASNSRIASGAAYVFVRSGTTWSQQAYLKASNAGVGDGFGVSASISNDTIVVGADREDSAATGVNGNQGNDDADGSGAAYVFVRSGTTWSQQAYLKASNTDRSDFFAATVSLSGDTIVVGASQEDSNATGVNGNQSNNTALRSGAAYVFARSGTTWSQQAYLKSSNSEAGDQFGNSVAVSGDTVVVGAWHESAGATDAVNGNPASNGAQWAGAAYVFMRSGTTWSQQAYLKASNAEEYDSFGFSVAVSGDTAVVGAYWEDSRATGVNGSQGNVEPVFDAGAAYVFRLESPESFLVLGGDSSPGSFAGAGHVWSTQVSDISSAQAVWTQSIPTFSFPAQAGPPETEPGGPPVPVATFHAQVLAWNPVAFPANPEQWSEGLRVTLWSDGTATAERYGSRSGITIALETWEVDGQSFVRFPFSIEEL